MNILLLWVLKKIHPYHKKSELPLQATEEFGTLISDRPRLEAREAELRKQIGKLYDKRFITGAGPDRIQLNIDLMHLHTQLKQIGKQLNRPKVWY